jgi:riboflavin biosynthesis pyrimidine reductase
MQRVWPTTDGADPELDIAAAVVAEQRPAPAGRPWVVVNMIASVDGASADTEGRSGLLSSPGDRQLFHVLRATADMILAGAGTVRAEDYGAPKVPPGLDAVRQARGQAALPRMAVISASLHLDPSARLFREASVDQPPVVLTTDAALTTEPSASAGRELAPVADLRSAGRNVVDWEQALRTFHELGTNVLLVEGGPNVNGQLVARDLVDEFCLSVSPLLMCGLTGRIVADTAAMIPKALTLDRVFVDGDFVFLRYLRQRDRSENPI